MTGTRAGLAVACMLLAGAAAPTGPAPPAASDGAAVALERVPPAYPKAALEKQVDGCVVVSFALDAQGNAGAFQVLESRPQGVFDAATLKALRQWRFQAPPRPGRYAQRVEFRLKGREAASACAPLPSFAALNPGAAPLPSLRVLEAVMPAFPRSGPAADGGCVTVRIRVKYDGFVGDVTVLEARPQALAEPAMAALKQWHFQSFPPPDVEIVRTFNFTPEVMRLPEGAIRAPYADLAGGEVRSVGCGGKPLATAEARE